MTSKPTHLTHRRTIMIPSSSARRCLFLAHVTSVGGLLLAIACDPDQGVLIGRNYDSDATDDDRGTPPMVEASERTTEGSALGDAPALLPSGDSPGGAPLVDPDIDSYASAFCLGYGPVELPSPQGCTGDVAKRAFRFAICSCSDLVFSGVVTTDAFRSDTGQDLLSGGSIGVNGRYITSTQGTTIGGSLWTQGDASLGGHDISGDLHTGGALEGLAEIHVAGDAYVAGDTTGSGVVIGGKLFTSPQSSVEGLTAAQGIVREDVTVSTPCNCDTPIDIGRIVAYYATQNDNAAQGILADELTNLAGPTDRVLRCGRYFFSAIDTGSTDLTLHIVGRTVVAVGGVLKSHGALRIEVEQGAERDLFVASDVELIGTVDVGDRVHPSATRIYAGAGFLHSGEASLAANLYLPATQLTASTRTEVWGSIFARGFELSGTLAVHYDQSVLDVEGCAPANLQCQGCGECANPAPACLQGHCEACTADDECCPPLRCEAGRCVADAIIR